MPTRGLPRTITSLLECFRGCFTAPTFEVFCALTVGFWAQPRTHTVIGMLTAAGLSATWHHARAHRFFSAARWSADQLGLVLLDLILALLVPADTPVRLVVDDTLFRRSGRRVFGAAWHHDPLGVGRNAIAWGNNRVLVGVLVDLPMVPHRPVCLPILARAVVARAHSGRLELASKSSSSSASTSAHAASTWSWTAPTPARPSKRYRGRSPSPPDCGPTPPCTSSTGHAGPPAAADHRPKAPACPA
jgi:DDE superfamily endonuclease